MVPFTGVEKNECSFKALPIGSQIISILVCCVDSTLRKGKQE